jgi:hypothetical protein
MLAAIPYYLAMSDGGFTSAANHDMAMRASDGERVGALKVFRSTWLLVTLSSVSAGLLAAGVVAAVPLGSWLRFTAMNGDVARLVLLIWVVDVLVSLQTGMLYGAYCCEEKYASGMFLFALRRLLEFFGMALAVLLKGGPTGAASGFLAGTIVGLVIIRLRLYWIAPWLRYGLHGVSREEMARLVRPALACMAFPLGDALNIQGMRLVVGAVLGPAAVAIFATTRTLSQLALQPKQVIVLLMEPEMAVAFGSGKVELFRSLFRRSCQIAFWLTVAGCLVAAVAGSRIMAVWTEGKVPLDWSLFGPLLMAAAANSIWGTALMVAYSTNRHQRIAVAYLGIYGMGTLAMAYVLGLVGGLLGIGVALLVAEIVMTPCVVPSVVRMTGETCSSWLRAVAAPPWYLFRGLRIGVGHGPKSAE